MVFSLMALDSEIAKVFLSLIIQVIYLRFIMFLTFVIRIGRDYF